MERRAIIRFRSARISRGESKLATIESATVGLSGNTPICFRSIVTATEYRIEIFTRVYSTNPDRPVFVELTSAESDKGVCIDIKSELNFDVDTETQAVNRNGSEFPLVIRTNRFPINELDDPYRVTVLCVLPDRPATAAPSDPSEREHKPRQRGQYATRSRPWIRNSRH